MSHREFYSIVCNGLYEKIISNRVVYVYAQLIHFAVHRKLTQHYKLTILQ